MDLILKVTPIPYPTTRQDIAFFDAKKTGQLVSRLTTDVQEFKSSFKLVISQVSWPPVSPMRVYTLCQATLPLPTSDAGPRTEAHPGRV